MFLFNQGWTSVAAESIYYCHVFHQDYSIMSVSLYKVGSILDAFNPFFGSVYNGICGFWLSLICYLGVKDGTLGSIDIAICVVVEFY